METGVKCRPDGPLGSYADFTLPLPFLHFQISCMLPCLFLQSLMGNYYVSALSCISNRKLQSACCELRYMYILLVHFRLKRLRLYCKIILCGPLFKIRNNAVTSQITIKKTWQRAVSQLCFFSGCLCLGVSIF